MDEAGMADRDRLELLEGLLAALGRPHEVLDAVASSDTMQDAVGRVRDLLNVSEFAAVEILNMQWRRLARSERQVIQDHVIELRSRA